jgi:hypothetical protein
MSYFCFQEVRKSITTTFIFLLKIHVFQALPYVVSTIGRAFNDSSYSSHIRYHMHHLQLVSHQPQILRVRIAPLAGKCDECSLSLQVFLLPWVFFSPAQVPAKNYTINSLMTSIDSFESIYRCNGSPT